MTVEISTVAPFVLRGPSSKAPDNRSRRKTLGATSSPPGRASFAGRFPVTCWSLCGSLSRSAVGPSASACSRRSPAASATATGIVGGSAVFTCTLSSPTSGRQLASRWPDARNRRPPFRHFRRNYTRRPPIRGQMFGRTIAVPLMSEQAERPARAVFRARRHHGSSSVRIRREARSVLPGLSGRLVESSGPGGAAICAGWLKCGTGASGRGDLQQPVSEDDPFVAPAADISLSVLGPRARSISTEKGLTPSSLTQAS